MNYDATIISETFNDDAAELLYALLRSKINSKLIIAKTRFFLISIILIAYMLDLQMYPFSLSIFYPSLDKNDHHGRTPLYIKVIPRGDISAIRSDYSAIELMMVFEI